MRMRLTVLAGMAMAVLTAMSAGAQQPVLPVNATLPEMPKQTTRTGKHVNRVIDMWLKGQPVYYAQISGGGYEKGKEMAGTKADYITYEMEHGPLDFKELREFMRGLMEAGPTRTGHKTPTRDRHVAHLWYDRCPTCERLGDSAGPGRRRARHPPMQRREPGSGPSDDRGRALSVRAACRRFGARHARQRLAGLRGDHVGRHAAGVHAHRRAVADEPRWRTPLRPQNREPACSATSKPRCASLESRSLSGVPGDHGFYLLGRPGTYQGGGETAPQMAAVRRRVLEATKAAGVKFLNACNEQNVAINQLKDGVMICTGRGLACGR